MPQDPLNADLAQFERSLRTLTPRTEELNRDALMYRAGQASVQQRSSYPQWMAHPAWSIAAVVLLAACLGLSNEVWRGRELLARSAKPSTDVAVNPAAQAMPAAPQSTPTRDAISVAAGQKSEDGTEPANPVGDTSYFRLRNAALSRGVDVLAALGPEHEPRTPGAENDKSAAPRTQREMLHELLPPAHGDPSRT